MSAKPDMQAIVSATDSVAEAEVVALHAANGWSAAAQPAQLLAGLRGSDVHERMGFQRAGNTAPMWIHAGQDH